jgi:hypothetical protein
MTEGPHFYIKSYFIDFSKQLTMLIIGTSHKIYVACSHLF